MKAILLALVLTLITGPSWYTDIEKAKQLAQDEQKMILLNFSGSDWCNPCIKMKEKVFLTDVFTTYADKHLVLLQADFPRTKKHKLDPTLVKHNEALAEKYNPAGKFPLTLLLDSQGRTIRTWEGYQNQTPEEFVRQLSEATAP